MAGNNLLFIGAILSITLGILSLRMVRKNDNLEWNERLAAQIICWMFIVKGVQNGAVGYLREDLEEGTWQFFAHLQGSMDMGFSFSIIMIALLFPVPFLRTVRQVKIGFSVMVSLMGFRLVMNLTGNPDLIYELPGLLYIICGLTWGSIYVKFRLLPDEKSNQSTKNIATVSGLFLTLLLGHIWMWSPGLFFQSDYYYFFDLGNDSWTPLSFDYMWQATMTLGICVGLVMLVIEIHQFIAGNSSRLLYVISPYFILGMIGHTVLSTTEKVHHIGDNLDEIVNMWNLLTSQLHFTIIRPLIAMFILLKFGLLGVNEENRARAKIMTIILIVVATSAILELIQSIIPINQMLSAALLGIIIAMGVGWEEKSFDKLVNSKAKLREGANKNWFPKIKMDSKTYNKIDFGYCIFIVICLLTSLIIWKTDTYVQVAIERAGEGRP